jgi:hypothetical protein
MIKNYFNSLADLISADMKMAGTLIHKGDIGSNREEKLLSVLNNHLPDRMHAIKGGCIINIRNENSKQIDIIVRADNTPKFEQNEKTFVIAESVVAAITLKSNLTKEAIYDCLDNLASIPQSSPEVISFLVLKSDAREEFISKHPSLFIYAFDGVSMEKCLTHINAYYSGRKIPKNRYPIEIVIHGKYSIKFMSQEGMTLDGTHIEAGKFYGAKLPSDYTGYPLASIINRIYSYVDWMPYLRIDYYKYINASYELQK